MKGNRLSICYVHPGRDLVPGSSYSRQVLGLARVLAARADVTLAFRRVASRIEGEPFEVVGLEPAGPEERPDGAASQQALGRFVQERCSRFSVVLEGGWSLSGKLTAWCAQRGIAAVPIVDLVAAGGWLVPIETGRAWLAASGRYLRRAPVVIAGSEELKSAIVARWGVDPDRIVAIGPGVDRARLFPQDQAGARRQLGLKPEHRVLVAGGVLDRARDLTPIIEAVQRVGDPLLRLHVIGDGPERPELERLAGPGVAVTFHGLVPEDLIPAYIAAADLCVAVEPSGAAANDPIGESAFSVRECLAAGRPVVIAGGGTAHRLVRHLVSGFLVEHDLLAWVRFLQRDCPSRNTLRMMGRAATATPLEDVDQQAAAYLAVAERARQTAAKPPG
jgi:glycosyltransferase involved in cell wall biosynthesis